MDQFSLVQPVDRLGQGVIVAVAPAAYRRLDASFGQSFTVAGRLQAAARGGWQGRLKVLFAHASSFPDRSHPVDSVHREFLPCTWGHMMTVRWNGAPTAVDAAPSGR